MCSSCGGKAARLPGATPKLPIVFGSPDSRPAQPATFLVDHPPVKAGEYKYVGGDGVEQAVEDQVIQIGYGRPVRSATVPRLAESPAVYVKIGSNKWVGFKSQALAEQYAASVGGIVQTREQVLQSRGTP